MPAYIARSNTRGLGVYRAHERAEGERMGAKDSPPDHDTWSVITLIEEFHLDDERRKPSPYTDFPFITNLTNVFSARAVDLLRDWLDEAGELYPVKIENFEEKFFYFHCTHVVDCLDRERTVFSPNGRIIERPVFLEDRFPLLPIFMVPGHTYPAQMIFVLEPFKGRVKSAGLVGLELRREYFDPKPWRC